MNLSKNYSTWLKEKQAKIIAKNATQNLIQAYPHLFDLWALDHQIPPSKDFQTWVILGGRGSGKTRAGAEWVRKMVEADGRKSELRIALIGCSFEDARNVMVFGESGLMNISPPQFRPKWHETRKMLEWPNGASAQLFSAHTPDNLRGPQFHAAWLDEFAKWPDPQACWDMLQFSLRLGKNPQSLITTTPRNLAILKSILAQSSSVMSHAKTSDNFQNLPASFLASIKERYGGTRLGRQELDGEIVEDFEDALWREKDIVIGALSKEEYYDRIVVAIDPNARVTKSSDACGIVVSAIKYGGEKSDKPIAYVLEDASLQKPKPEDWAKQALRLYREFDANLIIAEVNQGGDMVEAMLRQFDPFVNFKAVHATRSKLARSETVAALYRLGLVRHAKALPPLEQEMQLMSSQGYQGAKSPDRLDAMVWGISELMLGNSNPRPQFKIL